VDRSHLTDRQRAILQRVADGDDLADASTGDKRSSSALHDRGLVVVRRSPWQVAIADAGRFYLEHGRYPDKGRTQSATKAKQQVNRQPSANTEARLQPVANTSPTPSRPKRPPPHTTARISAERRSAAVELVDELVTVGEKVIKDPDDKAQTHWRQVVDFAKRNQLVPAGKRIERTRTRWGELRIRLLNGPHPNTRHDASLPVVPMPTELQDLHPVVKALQDDSGRLRMAPSLRHRCLLYFHGLTQEVIRRSYAVREQPIAPEHRGRITTYGRPGAKD
jgi:chemotaxis protein histidine kinase CheA